MKELDAGYKDAQCYYRVPTRIWREFLTMSILASHQETYTVFEGVLPKKNATYHKAPRQKSFGSVHDRVYFNDAGISCIPWQTMYESNRTREPEHVVEGLTN